MKILEHIHYLTDIYKSRKTITLRWSTQSLISPKTTLTRHPLFMHKPPVFTIVLCSLAATLISAAAPTFVKALEYNGHLHGQCELNSNPFLISVEISDAHKAHLRYPLLPYQDGENPRPFQSSLHGLKTTTQKNPPILLE